VTSPQLVLSSRVPGFILRKVANLRKMVVQTAEKLIKIGDFFVNKLIKHI
jgi:hypothetical protein